MEFLGFVLVLVLALLALSRGKRLDQEIRGLHERIDSLNNDLARLKRLAAPTPAPEVLQTPVRAPVSSAVPAPGSVVPAAPAEAPAGLVRAAEPVAASPKPPPVPPPIRTAPSHAVPPIHRPSPAVPAAGSEARRVSTPAVAAATTRTARPRAGGEPIDTWEARIGGSWLNRIGVALLVIGIAFALGYSLTRLGPAGKAALATAASLAMIGGGVLLERRETYRFYGRGLIGGGWAALYATAYAVHELEATRVVESPLVGFALLLLVGVGMIGHSLRYKNQGLTSLAYGLGYAAIVLHSIQPFTLLASALLGFGTVIHLLRRNWYVMSLGGIVATYGCLFLWASRQSVLTTDVMRLGLGALLIDWVVFLVADFAREPEDDLDRQYAWGSSLLNALAAGWLSFTFWIKADASGGWRPLFAFGCAYAFTSTALRLMGRRTVQPAHSLAASLLLAVAFHKGLDRTRATWAWLLEAQAVVLVGVFLKDRFHRMLGCCLFLAPMIAIFYDQVDARVGRPHGGFDATRFLQTVVACGCFYLTFARLKAFASSSEAGRAEEAVRRMFSYGAFLLVVLALWVQLPEVWVAPAGAILLLLLFELSAARSIEDLRVQAHLAALFAAVTGLALGAQSRDLMAGVPARIPALLIVAAVYFVVFLRQREARTLCIEADDTLRPIYSWVGAFAVALVVGLEVRPTLVGPAWMILALLLIEAGMALGEPHLRGPGYVAALAATVAVLALSAPSHERLANIATRTPALLFVAAAYLYLFLRQRRARADRLHDFDRSLRPLFSWAGTALAALLVWLEARPTLVGPVWMILALLLVEAGIALRESDLRLPGYVVLVASHASLAMSNLTATGLVGGLSVRAMTVTPAIAATYYLWWRLRSLPQEGSKRAGDGHDEVFGRFLSYLGAAMIGLFVRFEFGLEGAALRWSLAMVVLLLAGHVLRDADLRFQGYLVAAAVIVRAVGFDFRSANRILGLDGPLLITIVGVAGYLAAGFLIRMRRTAAGARNDRRSLEIESTLEPYGPDLMWLLAVALTALYLYRTWSGVPLIVAWAVEGLCAAGAGFALKARSLRLSGLALLAVCVAMTLVRAFTTFDMPGRIVTFLVLGVALLVISFAYTRYRESIRKVL